MKLATWILIVWAYKGGITTQEFSTHSACVHAAEWVMEQGEGEHIHATCVPKKKP